MMKMPKFQIGQPVRALEDLFNDGTFPEVEDGALLVNAGQEGEVIKIGTHTPTDSTVYLVEFGLRVIGCVERELSAA